VEPIFLCSYHAYNLCDGAGAEHTRLAVEHGKNNTARLDSFGYAAVCNSSDRHANSVAIPFAKIARGEDTFPPASAFQGLVDLRKICHVVYALPLEVGQVFHEGVFLYKWMSDASKPWNIQDLLSPLAAVTLAKRQPVCVWCSCFHQRCVLGAAHQTNVDCKGHGACTDTFDKAAFALLLPRHDRVGMMEKQLALPTKAPVDQSDRVACRLLKCKTTFANNKNANNHMKTKHAGDRYELYPVEPQPKKKAPAKKRRRIEPFRESEEDEEEEEEQGVVEEEQQEEEFEEAEFEEVVEQEEEEEEEEFEEAEFEEVVEQEEEEEEEEEEKEGEEEKEEEGAEEEEGNHIPLDPTAANFIKDRYSQLVASGLSAKDADAKAQEEQNAAVSAKGGRTRRATKRRVGEIDPDYIMSAAVVGQRRRR